MNGKCVEKGDQKMMYASACADVLLHLELSVRPSTHLGRTGLDQIVCVFDSSCVFI